MTALVTGASRGIGKAIALQLAKDGFDVAINYASSAAMAEEVASTCAAYGVKALAVQCDVTDGAACAEMVKTVEEQLGGIDVLVNNAGITRDTLLMRMSDQQFDEVYNANLKSVFTLSKLVIPGMMKKRGGRIINISSVAGLYGNAGQTNYAAMKAGVIGFTKALSKEVGARSITVNAVAPGFIETDMTGELSENIKTDALARIVLKRFGQPDEIAKVVSFLASEDAAYITGQTIEVSGGLSL